MNREIPRQGDMVFDGATYEPCRDQVRLAKQMGRVWLGMLDHQWHTLAHVATMAQSTETSASARIRDLRKKKFGGHTIDRKRTDGGLFWYRLTPNADVDMFA